MCGWDDEIDGQFLRWGIRFRRLMWQMVCASRESYVTAHSEDRENALNDYR